MKAVILAGGEGTRLRPLTCGTPKPLTSLFDRPVMAHILALLKRHGIRDIAVTLCAMPQAFQDRFGDGSDWDVRLRWYREELPLGTAGGVAACRDFLDDDFLIISGDAVCDLDLGALADFHRKTGAAVTIALSRQSDPVGYGLVQTDEAGRVRRFIEKPAWDSVVTDAANTGIYVLSPAVLDEIPRGEKFDFAHDLFPRLLRGGRDLRALELSGYWCDMGTCGAYLRCTRDALAGRVKLELPPAEKGIRALSPIPPEAVLTPPVYIGPHVTVEPGARIGPYAVLEAGSHVGAGTAVTGSVVSGAVLGREARVRDSILCRGAALGDGAVLESGCVLGEGAVVEAGARLLPGVLLWPGQSCPAGTVLRFSRPAGAAASAPSFDPDGSLTGAPDGVLTPEYCAALGRALGSMTAAPGRIAVGCENSPACGMLAQALECGIRSAGGQAIRGAGTFAAAVSFAAARGGFDFALHVGREEDGQLRLRIFGSDGLPLTPDRLRQAEAALTRGELPRVPADRVGKILRLPGILDEYCRAAASYGRAGSRIAAIRPFPLSPVLCNVLWLMGARVAPRGEGRLLFDPSPDGLALRCRDESGAELDEAHTLACAVYAALAQEGEAVLPFDAPAAFDELAAALGGRILRDDRSDPALRQRRAGQRFLWDGIHRAAYLMAWLADRGMTLAELAGQLPAFARVSREIPLSGDRAGFMRAAAAAYGEEDAVCGQGMRIPTGGGWILITPLPRGRAVRLWAESRDMEAARELCDGAAERLQALDRDIKRRKIR